MTHASHPEIIKRLKRAAGHLTKTITMIEDGQPCLEVAQQLQAVTSALLKAKRVYVQDHIEHCLDETERSGTALGNLLEFKAMAKYL